MQSNSLALAIIPPTTTALAVIHNIVINQPQDDAAEIAGLVTQIRAWRLRGREYRIAIGNLLLRLHKLLAKPGSGSFMRYVNEECGMPYTTARDYMYEATLAANPYEIRNVEPPFAESNADVVPFDPNDGSLDEVELAILAHRKQLEVAQATAAQPDFLRDFNWKFTGVTA